MAPGYAALGFGALGSILPLTLDLGTFALLDLPSSPRQRGRKGLGQSFRGRKEPGVATSALWCCSGCPGTTALLPPL